MIFTKCLTSATLFFYSLFYWIASGGTQTAFLAAMFSWGAHMLARGELLQHRRQDQ